MQHIESLLLSSFGTIIEDEKITEISVNPDGRVWVERVGEASMQLTDLTLNAQTAKNVGQDLSGLNPISRKIPLAGSDFFYFQFTLALTSGHGNPLLKANIHFLFGVTFCRTSALMI